MTNGFFRSCFGKSDLSLNYRWLTRCNTTSVKR